MRGKHSPKPNKSLQNFAVYMDGPFTPKLRKGWENSLAPYIMEAGGKEIP